MSKPRVFVFVASLLAFACALSLSGPFCLAGALWTANGVELCGAGVSRGAEWPQITTDGSGGAIVTWTDYRGDECDIYARRVTATGEALWTANGVKLRGAGVSGNAFYPQITTDGSGGAIVTWHDYSSGKSDIYARRVTATGEALWAAGGVKLRGAGVSGDAHSPEITTDGSGGAIVTWQDSRSGKWDIYAQRVTATGEALWAANGVELRGAGVSGDAFYPQITTDGSGGAIVTWVDNRSGRDDIYAQRVVTTDASPTWYLAEGTSAWGFDCYVTIENPNNTAVSATVTYMTDAGAVPGGDINLPAMSQATINPRDILGAKDFSTKVECKEGKTIAVDRTMSWTGPGAPSPEAHCSVGVTSPAKTWYLPEGSSDWGFECWLLIQNPNDTEATATVTYMIEDEEPQTFEKKVPASSRATFNMADDIGAKDASIKVQADKPVIPERAMYRNNRRGGHDSIGTTSPATDYYLAEGTTDWGFTTYVLVQNPNDTPADVTVTYMTGGGPVPQAPFTMEPNSRKTIRVNDVLPDEDLSTQVHSDKPIIAERAMYWGEGTPLGEACHDSIGMSAPHTTFYLPDGQTSDGRETYTLIQNPNTTDVTVEITYMTPDGKGNVTKTEKVPASSRKTFNMLEHSGITGRAAVMVTSKTEGKKIMVERAMYWNNRGAGTDTIGGYSD